MEDWMPLKNGRQIPKVACLYVIRHRETGKQYVGKTINLYRRVIAHCHPEKGLGSLITRAVLAHGTDAFEIRIHMVHDDDDELLRLEPELIVQLGTLAPAGYNLTAGGEGHLGYRPSAETRAKLAEATRRLHTGRKRSPEACTAMGLARRGIKLPPHTDETKARLRAAHLGKTNPKKGASGMKNGMYGVRGKDHPAARSVAVWGQESMAPRIYDTVTDAAQDLGVTPASICDWCIGRYRPRSGKVFAYLE